MTTKPSTSFFILYFTGKDDPRDCIIMGEDTKPVYIEFQTPNCYVPDVRTTVYRNNGESVAFLDWTMGVHLGRATIGSKQLPMSELVRPGQFSNSRIFVSCDGRCLEWRRCTDDRNSYDLYYANTKIAIFRRFPQPTPVGPSHGYVQYTFKNDLLLIEALIALSLNRWLDWRGM